jgi:hypothetical protein
MPPFTYTLEPVTKKPKKTRLNKYTPIIIAFQKSPHKIVQVENLDKKPDYVRQQLVKVIKAENITGVKATVRNNGLYLEKE